MLRIGYTFGNGKAWVDKNNKNKPPFAWGSGTAEGVLAGEYDQSEQLVNGAQELIKRKLLNGDTGTGGQTPIISFLLAALIFPMFPDGRILIDCGVVTKRASEVTSVL